MSIPTPSPAADHDLQLALLKDRYALRKLQRRIQQLRESHRDTSRLVVQWEDRWHRSCQRVQLRRAARPEVTFPDDLPICRHVAEISAAIRDHQVVIVAGETGSGKSTQLPKIALALGYGVVGAIGHTQPRRIAARTIAARVAEELRTTLGREVGYKVRFSDQTSERTLVKLMTDGVLLAETQHDRYLESYDLILIDEAHERSLNIDFLLGYLRRLLPQRPELRVVITSATIDSERFAEFFAEADRSVPRIEVSGRTYPVDVRYQPLVGLEDQADVEPEEGVVRAVRELVQSGPGDLLVFLPTEHDIRETARRLRGALVGLGTGIEILPLYARLSTAEQQRVFQPHRGRRIVLSTNVAESSLTVPGIRYVVDTGTARISRYSPRSKVQRLPIESVSRASADQRAGRCGRVGPGICVRLYSEEDYRNRREFTTPEIQRTNLASVILQSLVLRLGPVAEFPFLDPPRRDTIQDGYRTLFEIGAIDAQQSLTSLGHQIARLPIDPRLARVVLAAQQYGCLSPVLVLAAALEIKDPRDRPLDKQQQADECHAPFRDERSDFIGLLKLWQFYHELKQTLSRSQLRKACAQNFLNFSRMREWTETNRQLQQLVRSDRSAVPADSHDSARSEPARWETRSGYAAIHQSLLTGFLSGVALRRTPVEYVGAGGITFHLWPGSGVFSRKPLWCMVAELVETNRRYGRLVAEIDPAWIEQLAGHLARTNYHDPHWHRKRCTVMAFERVSLFGLPIVPKRRVPYGAIDPTVAHELFLEHGLKHHHESPPGEIAAESGDGSRRHRRGKSSEGESAQLIKRFVARDRTRLAKSWVRDDRLARQPFFRHNQRVLEEATRLAAKSRRADALVDDFAIYRFYDSRIPGHVHDLATLQQWLREQSDAEGQCLRMEVDQFLSVGMDVDWREGFPDELRIGETRLPLDYRFDPGHPEDGVTVTVPAAGLRQLQAGRAGWLVPGLVQEKITALIRSLPKSLRTHFIPAPDVARRIADQMVFGEGDFLAAVLRALRNIADVQVQASDFDLTRVPAHLALNVRVIDTEGSCQTVGRDVSEICRSLGIESVAEVSDAPQWHRDQITCWDIGDLPPRVPLRRGGIDVTTFPTLVDAGDCVCLRLYDREYESQQAHRAGVRRLVALHQRRAVRAQLSWLPKFDQWILQAAPLLPSDQLRRDVADLLVERAFLTHSAELPRTQTEFEQLLANATEKLALATQDVVKLLPKLFSAFHECQLRLESTPPDSPVGGDVSRQLQRLFPQRFLVDTPWEWLRELPRYLRAATYRLERTSRPTANDLQSMEELEAFWTQYQEHEQTYRAQGKASSELERFRWMLEEYRVSLFAQPLGTRFSISAKRLHAHLAKL